jgi:hypothetical protein
MDAKSPKRKREEDKEDKEEMIAKKAKNDDKILVRLVPRGRMINKGDKEEKATGFRVNFNGHIHPLGYSTWNISDESLMPFPKRLTIANTAINHNYVSLVRKLLVQSHFKASAYAMPSETWIMIPEEIKDEKVNMKEMVLAKPPPESLYYDEPITFTIDIHGNMEMYDLEMDWLGRTEVDMPKKVFVRDTPENMKLFEELQRLIQSGKYNVSATRAEEHEDEGPELWIECVPT